MALIKRRITGTYLPVFAQFYEKTETSIDFDDDESHSNESFFLTMFTASKEYSSVGVTDVSPMANENNIITSVVETEETGTNEC